MHDPWREPGTLATVVALPVATVVAVILVYGRWGDIGFADLFWTRIRPWSLFGMPVVMTLVTGLAGIAGAHRRHRGGMLSDAGLYALVVMPVVFLAFYPGASVLGGSDGRGLYLLLLLAAIHGFGFVTIRESVERAEGRPRFEDDPR